jgi:phage terminase large subunit-like protein
VPYSQQQADIACNFFEGILKHTVDDWYGKPFLLVPWQEEAIAEIFGRLDDDGSRLISTCYLEVPKKTGKTEWAAGLVLLILVLDMNPGCQVYGAAASQRQALNVFRAACKMVEQSPLLSKRLRILRGTSRIIKRSDPDSFYAAIAADGDVGDGVNPSCVVADEVHRWRTRKQLENWDVLTKGGITRRQSLTIAITTAGVQNESPLAWRLHEKTKRLMDGVAVDPSFYGRIYAADQKDDWTKEETWIKANPSLKQNGGFLDIAAIRKEYESSLSDPGGQVAFRRYFLNLWDQHGQRAIDMKDWHACAGPWPAEPWPISHDHLARFIERPCYVGIDLSMTTDMSAVAAVFPADGDVWEVVPFFWMPKENLKKAELQDGMPYTRWAEEGWIEACDGQVIDSAAVRKRLEWMFEMFQVREFDFDRFNTREMSSAMLLQDRPCVEVPQTFTGLSEGTKRLLQTVKTGKLRHGGHPVLAWNAQCLTTKADGNDLIRPVKPDREKDSARIDGLQATITAMSRAILASAAVDPYSQGARLFSI